MPSGQFHLELVLFRNLAIRSEISVRESDHGAWDPLSKGLSKFARLDGRIGVFEEGRRNQDG